MTRLTTLLLTQRDVGRVLDMRMVIRAVEEASRAIARGDTVMPSKLYLPLPRGSDFRAMPAYIRRPAACGVKWVNVHPQNPRHGLPTVMALVIINDPATGVPLAVMDGLLITKLRTAASAAVAAKALSRPESRVVGLVGCGAQAEAQIEALAIVRRIQQVRVWGYRPGEAAVFCRRMRRTMARLTWEPAATVEACVRNTDILVTLTPSRRPVVRRRWLQPGVHINAVGADAPGKQELEPQILRQGGVIVDDREQAIHGGEINVAVAKGQWSPRRIRGTLGEVLLGRVRGRRGDSEITVFDSTGLAVHDVAVGSLAFRRAKARHVGEPVLLIGPGSRT